MSYKPGEIYFVRESVLGTDQVSPFVKIGLVASPRTSEERLDEHQTGNPRRLKNQAVVKTGAVHRVEAVMHRVFAPYRVSGEWFKFEDEAIVAKAIAQAQDLAKDVEKWTPTFDDAEALAAQVSTEDLAPKTAEIEEIAGRWALAKAKVQLCGSVQNEIREKFIKAIEAGVDVKGAAIEKEVFPKPKFNTTTFKKEQPAKYEEYTKVSYSFTGPFKVTLSPAEREALDQDFLAQLDAIEAMVAAVTSHEDAYLLNEPELLVTNLEAIAQWELDIAEAQLKIKVGTHAGITDVCTWPRKNSERKSLDEGKLAAEEPELWVEYVLPRDSYKKITVARKKN